MDIATADIKSRVNTGRSLMPEGFEGLGGEVLRDILTFMCGADAQKFRVLDLSKAFTVTESSSNAHPHHKRRTARR